MIFSCIEGGSDQLPSIFTDTSTLTIQYDNLGSASVSFVFLHKSDAVSLAGPVRFSINGRNFVGYVNNISPSELQGTVYKESRISFVGFAC